LPGGNIVLVWDNSNIHRSAAMKSFIADHPDWLRVFHLPAYAPELNPAEGIWSLLKRSITNFLASDLDHLIGMLKHRLKVIQHHPHLINGCLPTTGLHLPSATTDTTAITH
jgi:transposase